MMKILALIPLILEINNSVSFLNLIPNMEEQNLEFAEELNIAMYRRILINTATHAAVGLEFDLEELVAELAARRTCRGELQLVKIQRHFKNVYYKLPFN